ncbi:unnamed protein product [marine sediment metagenome]|uniref:Uncharacterized protein n=1 Tax=marine sediment metagenome TaxID=412755 RepID=X1NKY5_9ZZZZ
MLEIRRAAITFDENEKGALSFLKKAVYNKITRSQQEKLKYHLDINGDPVERFRRGR